VQCGCDSSSNGLSIVVVTRVGFVCCDPSTTCMFACCGNYSSTIFVCVVVETRVCSRLRIKVRTKAGRHIVY
jgi:hypothetical protein